MKRVLAPLFRLYITKQQRPLLLETEKALQWYAVEKDLGINSLSPREIKSRDVDAESDKGVTYEGKKLTIKF
jgi:hypothetical protein